MVFKRIKIGSDKQQGSIRKIFHRAFKCLWIFAMLKCKTKTNVLLGFLVADTQLYKRLCPSVGPLVRWPVRWSVGP